MRSPWHPASSMPITVAVALMAALLSVAATPAPAAPACPPPPPPVRDLDLPRFYADKAGTRVDPDLDKAHKSAVEPLTAFLRRVVDDTDKALRRRDAEAARCPLAWIEAWARGEAWLGRMETKQAEYQRKWDLAGVALAYVKLKPFATPAQRSLIEPWLVRFADQARRFFDDPARTRNNHWYWLGLGLAATGLAAESPRHWSEARAIFKDAAGHVGPDGTLPLELARQSRALHYHAFAVTPLVVMAELAAARGEDWYRESGAALHRLVALVAKGLADPAAFDRLAATPQERPPGTGAGWLALYRARFPDRLPGPLPEVPEKHRWLGGNVLFLAGALGRPELPSR